MTATTTTKRDNYQIVTDTIVCMLESGTKPWQKGWKDGGFNLSVPVNASTGKPYRGINTLLLWGSAEERGFQSNQWLTFNQAKAMGAKVKKGEKSSTIVFYSEFEKENDKGEEVKIPFLKSFSVFNLAQIDNLPDHLVVPVADSIDDTKERIARADAWVSQIGADVRHGGNRAFYRSSGDFIQMPEFSAFHESEAYYATLAHELTHWTGIESRLNREFGKKFGDSAYAFEELVAELSAAFTCARLGISDQPREDHASYLASWLKVLKADKRAIFTAASKAQQACDYLFEMAGDYESEIKPVSVPVAIPAGVICLPDLSRPISEPIIMPVVAANTDDDEPDPTPPSGPSIKDRFGARMAGFKGRTGHVRRPLNARQMALQRKVSNGASVVKNDPVAVKPAPVSDIRPFHPRRDPSLCEYLSLKGICDDGGELKARDLDRWHREAPFRRKLVRPDGVSLETAARMAWEAGYFDHVARPVMDSSDNMNPVTVEMLIAALDRELRGDFTAVWNEPADAWDAHDEAFFS